MPEAWRCDACEYVHPESAPPEWCPACDVGPFGSWTGAQGAGDRLKSEADEARIVSLTQENKRLREAACVTQTDIQITDEMFERAWRAFDHRAAGGADRLLDEPWFEDALRDAVAAAFDERQGT